MNDPDTLLLWVGSLILVELTEACISLAAIADPSHNNARYNSLFTFVLREFRYY